MKQPNFSAMSPAVAKAIEQMMAEQGDKFSLEKINLAELERRTGISRARLRRMKEHGFEDKTARVMRSGSCLYIYSSDMTCLLTTHEVTWDYQDSFCANQYAFPDQPEEFPSMPVKTVIRQLPQPSADLSFEKFNFTREDDEDD